MYLTSGIRALYLADIMDKYFFIFADFLFGEKKKEGPDIPEIFSIFLCTICRNRLYILFPLRKTPKFKKKIV
jgi:hypothetical protein